MITITCPPLKATSEQHPKIVGKNLAKIYKLLKGPLELPARVTRPTLRNGCDADTMGAPLDMDYIPKDGDRIEFMRPMSRKGCWPGCFYYEKKSCPRAKV